MMGSQIVNYFAGVETTQEDVEKSFPTKTEVDAMQSFVLGQLQANEAARLLTSRTANATTPFSMDSRMRTLWTFINQTAVAIPSAQPSIIQLLSTIRNLGPLKVPKEGEGADWGIDLDDGEAWGKLPHWANDWADLINFYESNFLKSPNDEKAIVEWVSTISYSARLTATGDPELIGDWFFIRRCCPSVVRVLDIFPLGDPSKQTVEIPAAAQLFFHASKELFGRSLESDHIESLSSQHVAGDKLWQGDLAKLSVERWKHWKNRWAVLGGSEVLSEGLRTVATGALKAIEQAEPSAG